MALYIQLSTQNVFTKYLSVSSITGGNSVNTDQLTSTVASLITNTVIPPSISTQSIFTSSISSGTIQTGVISTLVLYASSIVGVTTGGGLATIPSTLSTFAVFTSSLQTSTLTSDQIIASSVSSISMTTGTLTGTNLFISSALISTLSTNNLNFAGGFGFLTMPDIYPNTVYTSTITTSNVLVGINSIVSPIQFFGQGTYSNTVIAEVSTGATTQELLMFRGSNATDRIRMQTTGSIVFEPGVSARLWPTVPSNVTPAMVINTSSNVGIQTASPGATLDVAGIGRFLTLSTFTLNTSSINGQGYWAPEVSSLRGLGTLGYISTSQLVSTTFGLVEHIELTSSIAGLGTIGYISSAQFLSATSALIDTPALVSTVQGLGQIYLSTGGGGGGGLSQANLTSTIVGLGTLGYLSTPPLFLSTAAVLTSSLTTSTLFALQTSTLQFAASTATMTVGTVSSMTTNTITIGSGSGWILTSPIQTAALSTNTLWADATFINTETATTAILSTVTTNQLTVGAGGGWLTTSPLQTLIVSSIYSFADTGYVNTLNVGSVSTVNSVQFAGLYNAYNNTAVAEISTGAGTQELLMFKGSSASDRVRIQTTGAFVVETGVSARLWNSNATQTLSNATPAFLINTSSNVGIQTASPGTALDVAGTSRAVSLSSQSLTVSSFYTATRQATPMFIAF